jgi:hypothetical protein
MVPHFTMIGYGIKWLAVSYGMMSGCVWMGMSGQDGRYYPFL